MENINLVQNELESVLQNVANALKIKNSEIVCSLSMSIGDGLNGHFYNGIVKNKDTGEVTEIAIKKAPKNAPSKFDFSRQKFKNEYIFYSQIFPSLDAVQKNIQEPFDNVPKYICGGLEPKMEYIAMENLQLQHYTLWDKKKVLDEEHLHFIFKIYGQFHAISFVLKNKNREKYYEIIKETSDLFRTLSELEQVTVPMQRAFRAAFEAFDTQVDKNSYEKVNKYLGDIKNTFANLIQYKGEYNCITHGDCWSNNMLFKYNKSGVLNNMKLIDFQLIRDGTPVHDLSYFFYSGACKNNFDKLDSYLEIYYKSFSEFAKKLETNPEELYPLDVLKREWKEYALFGVYMAVYLWQVKLVEKERVTEIMGNKETSMETKSGIWQNLLNEVSKSDEYRKRTKDILLHATEYGLI